jgi:glycolate oxidase iron-sulfur subunit
MQTALADYIKDTAEGTEADAILRRCVHCGFCNATCPTYQLLGDELDGPRGRIYLIKQLLEGAEVTSETRLHLDRCLTCRNCETTCPSGVEYGRLLDIGRGLLEQKVPRSRKDRLVVDALQRALPHRRRFAALAGLGRLVAPLLPASMRPALPARQAVREITPGDHARRMLLPAGCVQPALAPSINAAARRVLDQLGIAAVSPANDGCCGALHYHLGSHADGLGFARRNIDAWWPYIKEGIEAIVSTASGCGVMIKDYGELLKDDPTYADKAAKVAELTKDLSEIIAGENCAAFAAKRSKRVAFQSPCTLQHGQRIRGSIEAILEEAGYTLVPVADAHLCCGSAGSYSILQPELAGRLRDNKLAALQKDTPDIIATANIGCLNHLQSGTGTPVKHWIELL